jgi:hypothetical protein
VTDTEKVATIAGTLSRSVGAVRALECARNAVSAMVGGERADVAIAACVAHRRSTAPLYGAEWLDVSDTTAALLVALAARRVTACE